MGIKAAVVYYSKSGHTEQVAQAIAEGMAAVDGVEARAFPVDEVDEAWVRESTCVVVGTPTYYASLAAPAKAWLEGPALACGLAGKLGGAFATEDYVHGGGELAIRSILDHELVFGMLTYSGGGSQGKPVVHLGPVATSEELEKALPTCRLYGRRMAQKAVELFG